MRALHIVFAVVAVAVVSSAASVGGSEGVPSWVQVQSRSGAGAGDGFEAMLNAVDAAQLELQNGRPEAYKALWSHSDDVTLSGGFGGTVEKGWGQVGRRLDWVAAQFSKATHENERIVAHASGELGYLVQLEHIRFHAPGQREESSRDYRVTMIFRREAESWRIVHRQADSQLIRHAPH
jgi:ketosteroid isomerase-like protein